MSAEMWSPVIWWGIQSLLLLNLLLFAGLLVVGLVYLGLSLRKQKTITNRCALRKQIHQDFLDIDFYVYEGENFDDVVKKVSYNLDLAGTAYEVVKKSAEEAEAKKREKFKKVSGGK
jgi:hypothetical protein